MEYDLIVVGSGSVGSATGYYAAKSGLKVLMIDSHVPPHRNGSHHGATRIFRCAYGEGPKYVPLCLRAKDMWHELEKISDKDLLVHCGVLNTGSENSTFMKSIKISCEQYKLNVDNLTSDEINRRWRGISVPDGHIGVFENDAGYVKSELAVATFMQLSKNAGARQLLGCVVESVRPIKGGVEVVTNEGKFRANKAVVSAGTWVKKLVPNIPVTPVRKVFTVNKIEATDFNLPVTIVQDGGAYFYSIPDEDGYKVGKHDGGQVMAVVSDLVPFGSLTEDFAEATNVKKKIYPGVSDFVKGLACSYDMTPDEDFIIDTLPESDNILLITGLSGHGFKFSTVLGEIATAFARGEKSSFDLKPFSLKRFQ